MIHFECFGISLFFIIASFYEDAMIVIALTICFQPIFLILSKSILECRKSKIQVASNQAFLSSKISIFLVSIENKLKKPENSSALLKLMNKHYSAGYNKLIFVLQADYCESVLNNPHLGLLKASQTNYKGFSLFTNFQIYLCQKRLEAINKMTLSELKLSLYLQDLQSLVYEDKTLCLFFLKFLENILSKHTKRCLLIESTNQLVNLTKKIKENYETSLEKYNSSQIINEMYGSLLLYLLFNEEKGQYYLNHSINISNRVRVNKEQSIYGKKNLQYMIVSGDMSQMGKVLYISPSMKNFLNLGTNEEKDKYFSDFIPKPYSENHHLNLLRYLHVSTQTKIFLDFPLFFNSNDGYLIECFLEIMCVGFDSKIQFTALVENADCFRREAAIVDQYWLIHSHTKGFPVILDQNNTKLENKNLYHFIPIRLLEKLLLNQIVIYPKYSNISKSFLNLGLVLQKKQVYTKTIFVVYIVEDEKIINKFLELDHLDELQRFKKIRKIFEYINTNNGDRNTETKFSNQNSYENGEKKLSNLLKSDESFDLKNKELKMVTISKRMIRIIKVLVLLTVSKN